MRTSLSLMNVSLPRYQESFTAAERERVAARMREWNASEFAGYRRILDHGSDCHPDLGKIRDLAAKTKTGATGKPIRNFVLLGTGGSSLGGETMLRCLHAPGKFPEFHFVDNNDPDWFHSLLASMDPEETLFYVVSKSGKTPETISQFLYSMEWLQKKVQGWEKHFVLCTDPEKGDLRQFARRFELPCLDVPPAVGGRFSVLTPVGLFPAAFAQLDLEKFLDGARSVAEAWEKLPLDENPAAKTARSLALSFHERPVTVFMPYSSRLGAFSRWFSQLWAESLGKAGKGPTPYPAVGTTDQHSQVQLYMEGPRDKCIVLLRVREYSQELPLRLPKGTEDLPSFRELQNRTMLDLFDAEFAATRDAFTQAGIPNATIELDRLDEFSLGALFFFWEWTTAFAGAVMDVNPFDQPGVEAAKILTKRYLQEKKR